MALSAAAANSAGTTTAPEWSQPPESSNSKAWAATPLPNAAASGAEVAGVPHSPAPPGDPAATSRLIAATREADPATAAPSVSSRWMPARSRALGGMSGYLVAAANSAKRWERLLMPSFRR
ncbi:MAG TPA: hypothetical protein VGD73_04035 [Pseudonocardia sp.]